MYLGLGVGFLLSTAFGAKTANTIYNRVSVIFLRLPENEPTPRQLAQKNGGVGTPEMRIPALFFGSLFVPVGLLYVLPLTLSEYD